MSHEPTDEQLLALSIRDGDAFGAFYERHARSILAYATRRLGSPDLGAEVTAETFACALEGARRFRPEKGPATAWLYGIARNQISRTLERGGVERRHRMRLGIADLVLDDDELARIEELAASEGAASELRELLAVLPADQRESLQARVVDGQSYDEIALGLHITPTAARKRVSRALGVLRAKLGATS